MENTRVAPMRSKLVKRIYIHKAPVDIVEPRNLLIVLSGVIQRNTASQILFVRTWDVFRANHDPLLLKTMNEAALVLPVSKMIVRMARFLGYESPSRYYPFDTVIKILTWLESMGGSLFLLGGSQSDISSVETNVKLTFPSVRLLGRYAGTFPKSMSNSVAMAIRKADPDILLAGNGLKGRDRWLFRHRRMLNRGIQIWSGEWFDFVIGRRRRPPKPAVRNGNEWISELSTHPGKVFRVFPLALFWLRLIFVRLFR